MSEYSTGRPVSGLAITSLVLGIITLLMFWIPILHLFPGLLAVVLGIIGFRKARQGTASGGGLAVAGIICAALGMIPSFLFMLAAVGIGIAGPELVLEGIDPDGPAGVTLQISRNEFFEGTEAYRVGQEESNLWGSSSSSGVEQVEFEYNTLPSGKVKYSGTLEVTSPKHLLLTLELENEVPFRLSVEGLNEVAAQEGEQPLSLGEMLPPGTHSIRITGVAP